ncbi:hypothetical protein ACJX0J_012779, partial [Zea mays]
MMICKQLYNLIDELDKKAEITCLEEEDDVGSYISDEEELKHHITSYYKNLFGKLDTTLIELDESNTHDIPQVSNSENEILTANFTIEEVKKTFYLFVLPIFLLNTE